MGIYAVLYLISLIFQSSRSLILFFGFPVVFLYDNFLEFFLPQSFYAFVLYLHIANPILYFFIGAFLGLLYGKIRKKKLNS